MDAASFIPFNFSAQSWQTIGVLSWMATAIGISSPFASVASNPLVLDTIKLLVLGSIYNTGRNFYRWIMGRLQIRRSISAEFRVNTPTYEWLVSYLTKEGVWHTPRKFVVEIKSSQRKWKVEDPSVLDSQVDYVPLYDAVQFFRWQGYLLDVTQNRQHPRRNTRFYDDEDDIPVQPGSGSLFLTIYTQNASVLFSFVEECRQKYLENKKPHVIVHSVTGRRRRSVGYDDDRHWGSAKTKPRRPIDSLLLDGNKIDSLLRDAREFLEMEDWYIKAGIPHRRGYLLHGPPGTGKTSTVYTIAGELGLEIYSLSLSSGSMDDGRLALAVSSLPPRGILLIEDIDCAFPSRDAEGEELYPSTSSRYSSSYRRSQITLSGLLNVLDGIGSEEGKIFFATTNHVDRLDPALLRPGRIDRKIEYKLASQQQARALYTRFFPAERFSEVSSLRIGTIFNVQYVSNTDELAESFARAIPEQEFSVAELQGYLLGWKMRPLDAVCGVEQWIEDERATRREREAREKQRKDRIAAARVKEQLQVSSAVITGIGGVYGQRRRLTHPQTSFLVSPKILPNTVPPTRPSEGNPEVAVEDATKDLFDSPPQQQDPHV